MQTKKTNSAMLALLLVLFIDGMGLGLFFPILNAILIDANSHFLPMSMGLKIRNLYYGIAIGIYMLCWFFGAAILGDLSDSVGRKKSLTICLLGAFLSYIISALAIEWRSFLLLLVGRIVAGFTAGSQPIAQAAVVDISKEEHKSRNIGLVLLAVSLGCVLGPVLGGLLSSKDVLPQSSYATPMYFAAFLALCNALVLYYKVQETHVLHRVPISIRWGHAWEMFASAFRHKALRVYSLVLLVLIFGWGNYFSFIPIYLLQVYHYSAMQNSLFFAVLGLGFSIGCGGLVKICSKRYALDTVVIVSCALTALEILLTLLTKTAWIVWICAFFIGITLSLAYSLLLTIFSNLASKEEQGWVMGVTGSIMALCFGITSLCSSLLVYLGVRLPLLLAFIGTLTSAMLLFAIPKEKAKTPHQ